VEYGWFEGFGWVKRGNGTTVEIMDMGDSLSGNKVGH
jgi:hypothetical protein